MGHSHRLQFGGGKKKKTFSAVRKIAWNFPTDWRTGQKMGVCIIHQAIQTNMPLLDLDCQISLACVWFERTLISHRSHIYALSFFCFFSSLSPRMVCSEHHRPRAMCSCLAIINMSYSWAERQNIAQSHFFFRKLRLGKNNSSLPLIKNPVRVLEKHKSFGLECPCCTMRKMWPLVSSAQVAAQVHYVWKRNKYWFGLEKRKRN